MSFGDDGEWFEGVFLSKVDEPVRRLSGVSDEEHDDVFMFTDSAIIKEVEAPVAAGQSEGAIQIILPDRLEMLDDDIAQFQQNHAKLDSSNDILMATGNNGTAGAPTFVGGYNPFVASGNNSNNSGTGGPGAGGNSGSYHYTYDHQHYNNINNTTRTFAVSDELRATGAAAGTAAAAAESPRSPRRSISPVNRHPGAAHHRRSRSEPYVPKSVSPAHDAAASAMSQALSSMGSTGNIHNNSIAASNSGSIGAGLPVMNRVRRNSGGKGDRPGHNRRLSDSRVLEEMASALTPGMYVTASTTCTDPRQHYCVGGSWSLSAKFLAALRKGEAVPGQCWVGIEDNLWASSAEPQDALLQLCNTISRWPNHQDTCASIMPRCVALFLSSGNTDYAMRVFLDFKARGITQTAENKVYLIQIFTDAGVFSPAFDLAMQMLSTTGSVVTIPINFTGTLVNNLFKIGKASAENLDSLLELFERVKNTRIGLDMVTVNHLFEACAIAHKPHRLINLLQELPELGLSLDRQSFGIVIHCLLEEGRGDLALRFYVKAVTTTNYFHAHDRGNLYLLDLSELSLEEARLAILHHFDIIRNHLTVPDGDLRIECGAQRDPVHIEHLKTVLRDEIRVAVATRVDPSNASSPKLAVAQSALVKWTSENPPTGNLSPKSPHYGVHVQHEFRFPQS
eukprot:comp22020_c0_seq2/m.50674 comp22020_c0_seq2/g.50674  ORF comp22020_c0_seq2/g.50674 comp22020_c0_seq2/m.50674 type:complete len:678 (-) comp22020_c0_seq2:78-2111(-)